ncbi:MAG: inorganic diphosphatase [Bacteroidetes bacterium]|nr:inorganic diphosphatase [Bacteroidota bacterium]
MSSYSLKKLRSFFENYKELEHKEVVLEDFQDRKVALEVIKQSMVDYKAIFTK